MSNIEYEYLNITTIKTHLRYDMTIHYKGSISNDIAEEIIGRILYGSLLCPLSMNIRIENPKAKVLTAIITI